MLSLMLTLSLGQLSIWPPINTPPFGFDAPLEPIRIERAPALTKVGPNVVSLWLDRRRNLDLPDAGVDVWAGNWNTSAGTIEAVLLTRDARSCAQPRLAAESSTTVRAVWTCTPSDGGSDVVESVVLSLAGLTHLPPLTTLSDVGSGPILDLSTAASASQTIIVARRASALSLLQPRPSVVPTLMTGTFASHSAVVTLDGGMHLLATDGVSLVNDFTILPGGGWAGPRALAADAVLVVGVQGQPEGSFITQTQLNDVRWRRTDGGVQSLAVNVSSLPPLAAQVDTQRTLAVFRTDAGLAARMSNDLGTVTGTTASPAGFPLAIAGTSPTFAVAEALNGEVVLRGLVVSTVPTFGSIVRPFVAPAPQQSGVAVWSDNDNGFLTMWDSRVDGGWETRAAIVDNGGVSELGAITATSPRPSKPALALGPDGGLYVALSSIGGRTLYSVVGATPVMPLAAGLLDELVMGQTTFFTWSPSMNLGRIDGGSKALDFARAGCVAWWAGTFWYAPASGSTLIGFSETGASVASTVTLPPPPTSPYERCLTISENGTMLLVVTTPTTMEVHDLANGGSLGPPAMVTPAESPAAVGVADGVIAVVATPPNGSLPALQWIHFGPGNTFASALTQDTQPVRNVRAARAPNGDVLASWETFELDAGAWRVQTRIIHDPPFARDAGPDAGLDAGVPDAGSFDAGAPDAGAPDAGAPDAGVPDAGAPDAGVPDAGSLDAGAFDGGVPDAGKVDAGPPDAGAFDSGVATDAGVNIAFVPVCGCSGTGGLPSLVFGLFLLLRRLRGLR